MSVQGIKAFLARPQTAEMAIVSALGYLSCRIFTPSVPRTVTILTAAITSIGIQRSREYWQKGDGASSNFLRLAATTSIINLVVFMFFLRKEVTTKFRPINGLYLRFNSVHVYVTNVYLELFFVYPYSSLISIVVTRVIFLSYVIPNHYKASRRHVLRAINMGLSEASVLKLIENVDGP
ncbi:MAG: hypothetical protein K1060chlam2_00529 [Chlamydiae bacterium]|nr:hypothetical protein [Chlamydiota bacterium]